jgi:hypothetical protein
MAEPAPLAPGIPPVIPHTATYHDYYQDDAHDKAAGNYATIMNTLMVPLAGVGALTPGQVSDAVFASAVVDPQAFVMLVVDANHPDGHICLFHWLQCYAPQLGAPTEFDNVGYGFFGDLTNNQALPSIEWPANAFHQVRVSVRVPQREILDQALAANPTGELLGPFGNEDAGTDVIRVRQAMLVPFRYVRILLQRPLTPREAWVQLCRCYLQ